MHNLRLYGKAKKPRKGAWRSKKVGSRKQKSSKNDGNNFRKRDRNRDSKNNSKESK